MNYKSIDWNRIWKDQMLKNQKTNGYKDCALFWEKESAAQYWKMVQKTQRERIEKTIRGISFDSSSRVLDIGSGPGVLAIPIAKKVEHVTSVDPSDGMIRVLKSKMEEYGITNIHYIRKRWEDVNIEKDLKTPYDVVLASLSLGMFDIRKSIKKMTDVSSRYIYLYWFAGEPSWDVHSRNLMTLLHETDFHPMPRSDVLFNVLYQMGIYPHIRAFPYMHLNVFSCMEDAVNYFSFRYGACSDHQKSILRDYLKDILEEEDGFLVLRSPATCLKIWWEKKSASERYELCVISPDKKNRV
ncbi:MAG: class I SAM-dependent methyltransferase [bacterium]